jgi:hypothetical protein
MMFLILPANGLAAEAAGVLVLELLVLLVVLLVEGAAAHGFGNAWVFKVFSSHNPPQKSQSVHQVAQTIVFPLL